MEANWTIDLLIGDGDVTYYNKFPLVYVANTQERYRLTQGAASIEGQEPIVISHISDNHAPIPVRMIEANKFGHWELTVHDDENATPAWDTILNNVHAINRHISGADSTAARHTINGTAQKVRIAIKPQGATNITYYDVQSGYADVSRSYYTKESQQTTTTPQQRAAWFIPISMTFTEAGYGDSFILRNDLPSSPHMIEDSNADGLADGMTKLFTPTVTIDTDVWLIGGKSQKIVSATGTGRGIACAAGNASGTSAAACAWIMYESGDVTVDLRDTTAGANITSIAVSAANADMTRIDSAGNTWWRIDASSDAITNGNAHALYVRTSNDDAATFYVDGMYLQWGTATLPPAFSSTSALLNRYDPSVDTDNINYLDVWGVPGDLPALVKTTVTTSTSAVAEAITIGKMNTKYSSFPLAVLNSSDFTGGVGWGVTSSSAVSIGGEYYSTPNPPSGTGTYSADATIYDYLRNNVARVFLLCHKTAADNSIVMTVDVGARTYQIGTASPEDINTWSFVDVGIINIAGSPDAIGAITIKMTGAGGAGVFSIDAIVLMPSNEFMILKYFTSGVSGQYVIIDAKSGYIVGTYGTKLTMPSAIGSMDYATPGNDTTRYIYFLHGTESTDKIEPYDITVDVNISLEITPRTSHLLGTA